MKILEREVQATEPNKQETEPNELLLLGRKFVDNLRIPYKEAMISSNQKRDAPRKARKEAFKTHQDYLSATYYLKRHGSLKHGDLIFDLHIVQFKGGNMECVPIVPTRAPPGLRPFLHTNPVCETAEQRENRLVEEAWKRINASDDEDDCSDVNPVCEKAEQKQNRCVGEIWV